MIRVLGKGSYGKVYLVKHRTERAEYVMKVLQFAGLPASEREASYTEISLLKKLRHPAVVNFKEAFFARNKTNLCIVMAFADGGDLENALKSRRGKPLREAQVMSWFVQMLLGIHYMVRECFWCKARARAVHCYQPLHLWSTGAA